jgi:replicative DNA helicase
MHLRDIAAERAVLSGICSYGEEAYLDVSDLIKETSFTVDSNTILYKCIKHIYEKNQNLSIDIATIYSAASELGLSENLSSKEEAQHLKAILDFPVSQQNIRKFAVKIKKLEIARALHKELQITQQKIEEINGSESIGSIIGIAEESVLNFTNTLIDTDNNPVLLSNNIDDYINNLIENPIDQVGIPTGFPIYDQSIGGGLRRGTVNVIAARPKTGKTLLVDNMGYYIAQQGIPVLNMDTEMSQEDHVNRIIAMSTEVDIKDIETGKFVLSENKKHKITESVKNIKKSPIFYKSIAGKPFDEQLSIMRRWLIKHVGLNDDGTAKNCVVFYDYLKLMDTQGMSQDLKEYQLLGFMMTQLHNFAVKFQIPIVAFVQLNRDGITKESTDTASGSDRIIWLCSNFTIFKRKSDEEIAEDGPASGNRKLVPIISRHGGGLDDNDYINCHMKGWCAKISEGQTKLEISNGGGAKSKGFVVNENDVEEQEEIPFV